jgi:hypothetical protein
MFAEVGPTLLIEGGTNREDRSHFFAALKGRSMEIKVGHNLIRQKHFGRAGQQLLANLLSTNQIAASLPARPINCSQTGENELSHTRSQLFARLRFASDLSLLIRMPWRIRISSPSLSSRQGWKSSRPWGIELKSQFRVSMAKGNLILLWRSRGWRAILKRLWPIDSSKPGNGCLLQLNLILRKNFGPA